jgi:VCBS repeat-containing protein
MTEDLTPGATVARPEPGQTATVTTEPGRTYILDFDPSEAQVSVQGDDLILVFEDGARLVFEDLVSLTQLENGPNLQYAGNDVIALLIANGTIPGVVDGVTLLQPAPGQTLVVDAEAGQRYIVGFDPADAQVRVDGNNLILVFGDGGEIVIRGLGEVLGGPGQPLFEIAGTEIPGAPLFQQAAALTEAENGAAASVPTLETAAAQEGVPGTGASQYRDDAGEPISLLDAQGVIPPVFLEFGLIDREATDPFIANSAPHVPAQEALVDEAALDLTLDVNDLAVGSVEGSNPSSTGETVTGQLAASDPNGDPLTFMAGIFIGSFGTLQINADGTFTYTLTTNSLDHTTQGTSPDGVVDQFTYTVSDSSGNAASGTLTVKVADDAPSAVDDNDSAQSGETIVVDAAAGVLSNDTQGADGASVTGVDTSGTQGSLTLNADGSYSYTAAANASYTDVFTYTLTDGDGDTSTATLTIAVTDGSPSAPPAEALVDEAALDLVQDGDDLAPGSDEGSAPSGTGETVTGQLAASDPNGDTLTYTPQTVETDDYVLNLAADGSYTVTLKRAVDHGAPGSTTDDELVLDTVSYTVTDANGNAASGTLTVKAADDAPSAVDDNDSAQSGETIVVDAAAGVLSNDTQGADGASVTGVDTSGTQGSLTLNADGSYSYTAAANASYTDVFTYTLTDGDGDTSTATLTIAVEQAPSLLDKFFINEIALEGYTPGEVIGNDAVVSPTGTENPAFIEISNSFNNAVHWTDVQEGSLELVGPDGTVVVIDFDTMVTNDGDTPSGSIVSGNGFLVFYEDGTWQSFSNNQNGGEWGYYQTDASDSSAPFTPEELQAMDDGQFVLQPADWGLGEDTTDPIAVNLVQNDSSIDLFAANGAETTFLTGVGDLETDGDFPVMGDDQTDLDQLSGWRGTAAWHGHDMSASASRAAILLGAQFLDNAQFNGAIGDQGTVLTEILDPSVSGLAGLPADQSANQSHVFARTYDGYLVGGNGSDKDEVPIDTNQEDDWTTTDVTTAGDKNRDGEGSNDNVADSTNPQDPNDDFDPQQATGTDGPGGTVLRDVDEGQTVIDDALDGDASDDNVLEGGRGSDFLYGDAGNDVLNGEDHTDCLFGAGGDDVLNGGAGADLLVDESGSDLLDGGTGDDILITDVSVLAGYDGAPLDTLGDILIGGAGDDVVFAGAGDDTLEGGTGDDWLAGGGGSDTMVFGVGIDDGDDIVADFDGSMDILSFTDVVDTGLPGLDASDVDAAIASITNDGIGGDVTVDFVAGGSITFADAGSGTAITSIADLVDDPLTQILVMA